MNSKEFDYEAIFRREAEIFFDLDGILSKDEKFSRTEASLDAFHRLFIELSKELKIRDGWSKVFAYLVPFSAGITGRSDKMSCDFTIAVGAYGFSMELPLVHSWAIRHMGNEFWSLIASAANLGKAVLQDYGSAEGIGSNPNNDRLVKNNNGLVFSIARDYIFWEQSGEPSYSVGTIELTLPLETSFVDVRNFYKEGLRLGYRANYLLFRQAYQIRKAQERLVLRNYTEGF
jgi:hypothetical protein